VRSAANLEAQRSRTVTEALHKCVEEP
jgi:hypothetical protein